MIRERAQRPESTKAQERATTLESTINQEQLRMPKSKYVEQKGIRYRASKQVLEIGQQLTEVRDALGHEEFVSWVKDQIGWPERIAQKYMQAYKEYGLDAEKFPLESLFYDEDFVDM
jgi:hypothetical protein